jgi:hypothetical protein
MRSPIRRQTRIEDMITTLVRLTTEYVGSEDRIRMAGATPEGGPVVMWLTHRLAFRAVPELLAWLEKAAAPVGAVSPASPVEKREMQSFAQEAAIAGLKQQPPVVAEARAPAWLVTSIDFTPSPDRLSLVFRGEQDRAASIRFDANSLRQWLGILHGAWSRAEWPTAVWPDWIKREQPAPQDIVRH